MKKQNFEHLKQASLSHQAIKLGRRMNENGLARARENFKLDNLKQVHLDLFPHIDFEGTRISEIARRKGVSKQAVSQLVTEMVDMNLLYFQPDPQDNRAKRVHFHTKGPFAIQKGFSALKDLDNSLADKLGSENYEQILEQITNLLQLLDS